MIDLKLISRPNEKKVQVSVWLYESIYNKVMEICAKENIKHSDLARSMYNEVIQGYYPPPKEEETPSVPKPSSQEVEDFLNV